MYKGRKNSVGTSIIVSFVLFCSSLFSMDVAELKDKFQIRTERFDVLLTKTGVIESIKTETASKPISTGVSLTAVECGEHRNFQKSYAKNPLVNNQRDISSAKHKVVEKTDSMVVFSFEWENRLIGATQTLSIKEGLPYLDVNYTVTSKCPLAELYVQLGSNNFSPRTLFYPDGKRYGSNAGWEYHSLLPGYIFAYDPLLKSGIGLLVDNPENLRSFGYLQRGKAEGFGGNYLYMGAYSRALRWDVPGEKFSFNVKIVAGKLEDTFTISKEMLPVREEVLIEKVMPSKLIYWPDEKGEGIVILKNNSSRQEEVDLLVHIKGKIGEEERLLKEKVVMASLQKKEVVLRWDNKDRNYGYELYAEVAKTGKVIDAEREYFAVAEQFSSVGHIQVCNPGWMNREGQETYVVPHLRDNYIGIIEYYCWQPDEIYDLTPETEVFEPYTESQSAYRTTITRRFIKDLIKFSNQNGIRVVALQSGFASLANALKHPEDMKYTEDGQILLYNGKIYDNKARFANAPANIYTEEATRLYAKEMVASVDMFNWNGVRFDWGFIPVAAPDPLDIEKKGAVWYDYKGIPADQLFKDPDETGARLLNIWRKEVNSKYPRFEYLTNGSVSEETIRMYPKYTRVATTNSGLLAEYLLNYASDSYNTWGKWADVLVSATQRVRKNGGQPSVGWMRGYAPGGVTHQLLHYITFAAGFHWFGPIGPKYSINDSYKRFAYSLRFSEYFYDTGFKKLPEGTVRVEGSDRILWEPFVYERDLKDGKKEVAVHLINLPQSDYISMHHEIPETKLNIKISVRLGKGERCERVNELLPEPYPHKNELNFKVEKGHLVIDVPELKKSSVVVAEIGGVR
jgi:hypothetical protein